MVNSKRSNKNRRRRLSTHPSYIGDSIFRLLEKMGGSRPRAFLDQLWQNWEAVAGPEIAAITRPAGSKGATLFLETWDSINLQEAHMLSAELLERVNGFLQTGYFDKIKISLKPGGNERL